MKTRALPSLVLAALSAAVASDASAAEVRGRIRAAGRPVEGATVQALAFESGAEAARREAQGAPEAAPVGVTRSRADGSFALTLPASSSAVSVRIEGAGFVAVRLPGAADAGSGADVGEVRLRPAEALTGRVVDPRGQAVAGATVIVQPGRPVFGGDEWTPDPVVARTGPDGSFAVAGAAESGNVVRVEAPGFATLAQSGVRSGRLGAALALVPATPLHGRVLGQDGRAPAAPVLVTAISAHVRSRAALSGPDGAFQIVDAPAKAERLEADGGSRGRGELVLRGRAPGPIVLQLTRPTVVAGRVVDAVSLSPVPRARVEVRGAGRAEATRSGADGRYRIEGLPPGRYRVSAEEERRVPYARDDVALASGQNVTVDLPLRRASSLSGRVVDEEGRPVAGAAGRLRPAVSSGFDFRRSLRGEEDPLFRTGPDGSFRAVRVAPGDNQQLVVSHPEFEARTVAGLDLPAGGSKAGLTVVMRRGLEIGGRVLDAEGRPVAAAELEVRPSASERAGRGGMFLIEFPGRRGGGEPGAESAADGRFRLSGLAPGAYAVQARKSGYAEASVDPVRVERDEPAPAVELRLAPGAAIRGHVRRPDGSGARGQFVRARPEGGGDPGGGPLGLGAMEPTGDDGAFAIEGLRAGEAYSVQILGPPGPQAPPRQTGVRAPADDVELLVPGVGSISGRVVDAQTREPLTEFTAHYEADMPQGMAGMRLLRAPRRLARRLGGDEEEGAFRSPDGTFALEGVPAGAFTVVVEARGYESARVSGVVVKEGEASAEVEVRAVRGRAIRGRVLDAVTGRPVVGATVSAQEADRPGPPLPPGLEDGSSFSDADGRFDLPGFGLGMFKLVARHPDYSESSRLVELQAAQAEVEIRLSSGGALGGVVVSEGGAPVGGASVQLQEGGGGGSAGLRFGPGGGPGGTQTRSDDAGGFRFERLASGRYTVTASLRGRTSPPLDVALQAGEARRDLRVSLEAGATLRGRVVGLDAAQLASTNVSASGPQGYFAGLRPAGDGAFTLGGVPPGSIELRAMAGDFASGMRTAAAQVEIAEGQTEAEAEIAFEAQGAVFGVVLRGGEPLADVVLSASGGGGSAGFARSDASGAYRIEGLKDGSYTVTATPPSGTAHRQTVKVSGEASLDFDLPFARLSGAVREAGSGLPLADAEVEADADESGAGGGGGPFGRGRPRATTDSNGRFALEGLTPGPATLTARRTGYVYERRSVVAREEGGPELELDLKRGEGLGVRARDAVHGVPLRSLFAEARDASGAAVFTGPLSLDSDGRGEVPSLRPGAYSVRLGAPGYAPAAFRANVPSPTLDVAFSEGGSLEIRCGPQTQAQAPRARLLDGAGAPVPGPPAGPDGFFGLTGPLRRLEHLAPGGYTLAVEGGPGKPFTVTEGRATTLELP